MNNNKVKNTIQYFTMTNVILSLILLTLFIVIIVVFTWRVDAYRRIAVEEVRPDVEWVQRSNSASLEAKGAPGEFSAGFSSPQQNKIIRPKRWAFDYWQIEPIVQSVKVDATGQIILNDDMAVVLNSIVAMLPSELDRENLSRLSDLIEINIPASPGQEFAALVVNFYRYHVEFQKWVAESESIATTDPNADSDKLELQFEQSLKMMYARIGENNAEAIFGKQHALKEYLFQRRRINDDPTLSADEKNVGLTALEQKFKGSQQ
ncbi:hypothetical protein NBRC116493_09330 [Aurantivibrio infirmus]